MNHVIVDPKRCVGCMQCMLACAVAHSRTADLHTAAYETPRPSPRVHVGAGQYGQGFPNRCRHCNPAPCQMACLANAIVRDPETQTVMINPDRCINCASCAMACPYGVIRFQEDPFAPPGKTIAVKCDNCDDRVAAGRLPACVEACKTGALTFEPLSTAMKRRTDEVARAMTGDTETLPLPDGVGLYRAMRQARYSL